MLAYIQTLCKDISSLVRLRSGEVLELILKRNTEFLQDNQIKQKIQAIIITLLCDND